MKLISYLKNDTCNFICYWKKNYRGQQNTDNGMEPFQKKNTDKKKKNNNKFWSNSLESRYLFKEKKFKRRG